MIVKINYGSIGNILLEYLEKILRGEKLGGRLNWGDSQKVYGRMIQHIKAEHPELNPCIVQASCDAGFSAQQMP